MTVNIPRRYRVALYVLNVLGTPVVVYALAKGWIGELELTLWGAEVAAAMTLAGLNVGNGSSGPMSEDQFMRFLSARPAGRDDAVRRASSAARKTSAD